MKDSYCWRRLAFFGVLLAFVLASVAFADAAMPQGARADAPDTKLTVKVDGPVGPGWGGTVLKADPNGGATFHSLWSSLGIGSTATTGTSTGLSYDEYAVAAGSPVAPGWSTVGYAIFPSGDSDPECPTSAHAYQAFGGMVALSPEQPAWAVCVRVAPEELVEGTSLSILSVSTPWGTGLVDGPGAYDPSWNTFSGYPIVGGGTKFSVPVGEYTFTSDGPPFGTFARMVALNAPTYPDPCPADAAAYTHESVTFEVSLDHPKWLVCVRYFDLPIKVDTVGGSSGEWTNSSSDGGEWGSSSSGVPTIDVETPIEPPYVTDTPDIDIYPTLPDPDPNVDVPAANPDPTPDAVDVADPTPTIPEPSVTQEPAATPAVPAVSTPAPSATPLAPATGDTFGTATGSSWWFEGAILLMALSAVAATASRLPVRRKR